jgi:hypothetical protein
MPDRIRLDGRVAGEDAVKDHVRAAVDRFGKIDGFHGAVDGGRTAG